MSENQLLIDNESFIIYYTKSIIRNISKYKEFMDDLFQGARIAFLYASRTFDPAKSRSLQDYAKLIIQRSVFRMLSDINREKEYFVSMENI